MRAVLRQHPRTSFIPGSKFRYSNIGYWLLGQVVERAANEPFPSYMRECVLQPLEIAPQELSYVVEDALRHATGYLEKYSFMNLAKGFLIDRELIADYVGRWLEIWTHYPNGPAFGGLIGSVAGFGKFLQDQLRTSSKLFNAATRQLFYTPQRTNDGATVPMTLGWHIGVTNGKRLFFKEGSGGGFRAMMRLYPDLGVATVMMANATNFNVGAHLDNIDPMVFEEG